MITVEESEVPQEDAVMAVREAAVWVYGLNKWEMQGWGVDQSRDNVWNIIAQTSSLDQK